MFSLLLVKYVGVELRKSSDKCIVNIKKTDKLISKVIAPFYNLIRNV